VTARAQYGCTGTDQVTITVLPIGNQILANTANVAYKNANGTATFTGQSGAGINLVPGLILEKTTGTVSPYTKVGDTISYGYSLTNVGNVTLTDLSISDDHIGSPLGTSFTCGSGPLDPGTTTSCTNSYIVTQADLDAGHVTNMATGHAKFNGVAIDSNSDDVTVHASQTPSLLLTKTAPPLTTYSAVDQVINYTYTIMNSGNVTLSGPFTITDDKTAVACTQPVDGLLSPDEEMTCTATYQITQADLDAGHVTNAATGHANFKGENVDSNVVDATVNATQSPSLVLTKTAEPLTYSAVDQVINYTYVIKNNGNVTISGPFTITDDKTTVSCTQPVDDSLSPNEEMTCTATYKITQADLDAGYVTNTATGQANFKGENVDSNVADARVNAIQSPSIELTKTDDLNPASFLSVGQTVTYTLTATNNGNITLHNVSVSDSPILDGFSCEPKNESDLEPSASMVCSGKHTINQIDLDNGYFIDTASASSTEITASNANNVINATQNALLSLTKIDDLSPDKFDTLGQVVTFTLTATNNGNIILHNVSVSDSPILDDFSCDPKNESDLEPSASMVCSGKHTINQIDLDNGYFIDTASASSDKATAPDSSITLTAMQNARLELSKVANPSLYDKVDQVINYTYTIINRGNVTLSGPFTITDDKTSVDCTQPEDGSLSPAEEMTCTATYKITQADLDAGHVTNIATGHGNFDGLAIDSNSNDVTVDATQTPALTIAKTAAAGPFVLDDTITYTIVVTNTGNTTLTNVSVTDPNATLGACSPVQPATLAPGDSMTCSATHTVPQADVDAGSFTNTAYADSKQTEPSSDGETVTFTRVIKLLPQTGFHPGIVSVLPKQPVALHYSQQEMQLKIPRLGIDLPVVGVPKSADGWDVTWLGNNAGWLNGTAYPTWRGNSVLTGHVWDALNNPGPFAKLKNLKYGDQVLINAFGQNYVYEVRENRLVLPDQISDVIKHEEKTWLTLLTCENFDETIDNYSNRRFVRAVFVRVEPEK
jgi:LPXTG-site transpeptidase (sortase) family protein